MLVVPAATPVTNPVDEPTVATIGLAELQIPLPVLVSVALVPWHIVPGPVITGVVTVALPSIPQQPNGDSALK